jgi:hypothetical protein
MHCYSLYEFCTHRCINVSRHCRPHCTHGCVNVRFVTVVLYQNNVLTVGQARRSLVCMQGILVNASVLPIFKRKLLPKQSLYVTLPFVRPTNEHRSYNIIFLVIPFYLKSKPNRNMSQ